eukprot:4302961-Pyramimonas_sp.AAC.1
MPTAIKEREDPDTCPHPAHAKWEGANQHGKYGKCMACKAQLFYTPFTAEELEQRRLAKLTKDRQKAVRAEYKEKLKPKIHPWEGPDPWVASSPAAPPPKKFPYPDQEGRGMPMVKVSEGYVPVKPPPKGFERPSPPKAASEESGERPMT